MVNPFHALLASAAVGVLIWLLFRSRGLFWQLQRNRQLTERVLIEDALKHIYEWETGDQAVTIDSVSGALGVPRRKGVELLERIESSGLAARREGDLVLTDAGRRTALQVLRGHRLWEQYLSEKTGLSEEEWHVLAEVREHELTAYDADVLANSLQHPAFDPHGDPIPTGEGEMPKPSWRPLPSFSAGNWVRILHVEDEPQTVYAQLVAEGLQPGMKARIISVEADRIRFEAGGEEHVLAPVVAASLFAEPVPSAVSTDGAHRRSLAQLAPGEQGVVRSLSAACRGLERRRLMDLGILPGTRMEAEFESPSGDLMAYRVRESLVALRPSQARQIVLEHQEGDA